MNRKGVRGIKFFTTAVKISGVFKYAGWNGMEVKLNYGRPPRAYLLFSRPLFPPFFWDCVTLMSFCTRHAIFCGSTRFMRFFVIRWGRFYEYAALPDFHMEFPGNFHQWLILNLQYIETASLFFHNKLIIFREMVYFLFNPFLPLIPE